MLGRIILALLATPVILLLGAGGLFLLFCIGYVIVTVVASFAGLV